MLARVRNIEGYVSLLLTIVLVVIALLRIPKRFESLEMTTALVVLVAAIVFGIRGILSARCIDRAGAWLSLGVLSTWVVTTLAVGFIELVHSVAGRHPP